MTQADIESRLQRAIRTLLRKDRLLLKLDANERSITHKLAQYIQRAFPGWQVDCEYNRDGHDCKTLDLPVEHNLSSNDTETHTVFPDIIVHHRNTKDNLVALEAKKSTSRVSDDCDNRKLKAFKDQLGYKYAVFVRINTGNERHQLPQIEWK